MDQNIKSDLTDDGILIARIDMPGRTMNVFSLDMMDSLERLLNHVEENDSVRAVVITSAKSAFIAGADLDMILRIFTERAQTDTFDALHALCGHLGRLFRRLEKSTKPYVAAINGLALGGGLELCLACHARVVADAKGLVLGLPEIKLGLLPGAGGTQRLPRLVGTRLGMEMLLKGTPLTPQQAAECGLVDQVVVPSALLDTALDVARSLGGKRAPWDVPGATFDSAPFDFSSESAYLQIAETVGIEKAQLSRYPAYDAIMDCVLGGWSKPMDDACRWEMDCFVNLIKDPVAGNMVRTLFINRQRAAKLAPAKLDAKVAKVAICGPGGDDLGRRLAAGKAQVVPVEELREQDIALLVDDQKANPAISKGVRLAWLSAPLVPDRPLAGRDTDGALWLSDPGEHGCALEVVTPDDGGTAEDAGIIVGQWLRAMVIATHGRQSLLARLQAAQSQARQAGLSENNTVLAVALAAAEALAEGGIPDVELADVAAVVGGLHPAYTGGPFNYLRQGGFDAINARASAARASHPSLFGISERAAEQIRQLAKRAG